MTSIEVPAERVAGADTRTDHLRQNSVGLAGLTAESIGANGPELNALAVNPVVTTLAGPLAPLAYILVLIPGFLWGNIISRFSKEIVSAGGTYEIMRQGLGRRVGLFGGFLYFLGIGIFVPGTAVLASNVISAFAHNVFPHVGWFAHGHWFEMAVVITVLALLLSWVGVAISVEVLLGLSIFGMTTICILAVAILVKGGADGLQFSALLPWNVHGISFTNFAVGVGLAMGPITCSEGAIFLGEEAKAPKTTVRKAVYLALAIMIGFCIFASYALLVGVGLNHTSEFAQGSSIVLPLSTQYLSSWYGDLLLVVLFVAAFNSIAGLANMVTRLAFDWGRQGTLSQWLGRTHPRYNTPHHAILGLGVGSIVVLVAGLLWQGDTVVAGVTLFTWVLLAGFLVLLSSYALVAGAAVGAEVKSHSPVALRIIGALVFIAFMALAIFSNLHPFPPAPFNSAPVVALGAIAVLAVAAALLSRRPVAGDESQSGIDVPS